MSGLRVAQNNCLTEILYQIAIGGYSSTGMFEEDVTKCRMSNIDLSPNNEQVQMMRLLLDEQRRRDYKRDRTSITAVERFLGLPPINDGAQMQYVSNFYEMMDAALNRGIAKGTDGFGRISELKGEASQFAAQINIPLHEAQIDIAARVENLSIADVHRDRMDVSSIAGQPSETKAISAFEYSYLAYIAHSLRGGMAITSQEMDELDRRMMLRYRYIMSNRLCLDFAELSQKFRERVEEIINDDAPMPINLPKDAARLMNDRSDSQYAVAWRILSGASAISDPDAQLLLSSPADEEETFCDSVIFAYLNSLRYLIMSATSEDITGSRIQKRTSCLGSVLEYVIKGEKIPRNTAVACSP